MRKHYHLLSPLLVLCSSKQLHIHCAMLLSSLDYPFMLLFVWSPLEASYHRLPANPRRHLSEQIQSSKPHMLSLSHLVQFSQPELPNPLSIHLPSTVKAYTLKFFLRNSMQLAQTLLNLGTDRTAAPPTERKIPAEMTVSRGLNS